MKIYFFAAGTTELQQKRYDKITGCLKKLGCVVFTNLTDPEEYTQGFSKKELEKIDQSGKVLLEYVDGIVIESSVPSTEIGYLIAFALSHAKPILYLTEHGSSLNKELESLGKDKNITKNLKIRYYDILSLEKNISDFVEIISGGKELKEIPSIKFTLRITPSLEKYLDWKSKKMSQTKAEFLRNLLNDIKKGDRGYRK